MALSDGRRDAHADARCEGDMGGGARSGWVRQLRARFGAGRRGGGERAGQPESNAGERGRRRPGLLSDGDRGRLRRPRRDGYAGAGRGVVAAEHEGVCPLERACADDLRAPGTLCGAPGGRAAGGPAVGPAGRRSRHRDGRRDQPGARGRGLGALARARRSGEPLLTEGRGVPRAGDGDALGGPAGDRPGGLRPRWDGGHGVDVSGRGGAAAL